MRVIRLATVDSTNFEARRLVEVGERGPLWIVSAEQTAGKGRLGRQWVSKPGNFYGTLLWRTAAPQSTMSQVSFVAAVAVQKTASEFLEPHRITLKWPNDCLLDGAKFCGILVEVVSPDLLAIGIGINIAHVPAGLPYAAARLAEADVEAVFQNLRLNLSNTLEIWKEGRGFGDIRKAWAAHCPSIGATIKVNNRGGIFLGLGEDGALLLRESDGAIIQVYAGDVRVEYHHPK